MKYYRSQSFLNRIQINLAEISSDPNDEFSLHTAYYDPAGFDCELCDHRNCMYAYEVKNLKTDKILKVGSECIHHFKDKGVDIDLAEGLMKRVMSATNKARRDLQFKLGENVYKTLSEEERGPLWNKTEKIRELGKQEYKNLSKEEKRELIVNEFMIVQAKELLLQTGRNKHILSEKEIETIINLGLGERLEQVKKQQDVSKVKKVLNDIQDEYYDYIQNLNGEYPDTTYTSLVENKWNAANTDGNNQLNPIVRMYEKYISDLNLKKEYDWLLNYSGSNNFVNDVKSTFIRYKSISKNQKEHAQRIVAMESGIKDQEFEDQINWLMQNKPNSFVKSVHDFYKLKGFVSDKQKASIKKLYNKK